MMFLFTINWIYNFDYQINQLNEFLKTLNLNKKLIEKHTA